MMLIERIIELAKAGYKVKFEDISGRLRITVTKNGNIVRRWLDYDQLVHSCLDAETIVKCHIEKALEIMGRNGGPDFGWEQSYENS